MSEPASEPPRRTAATLRSTSIGIGLAVVAVAAVLGLAAVYGIGGLDGNAAIGGKCGGAAAAAGRLTPFARADVAAFAPAARPQDLSDLAFETADGRRVTLADWHGRTVLLNLWATWCVPCRAEMPALDRLQARAGGPDFEVVTVNVDTRDPDRPAAFLKEIGVSALTLHRDPRLDAFKALQRRGLASGLPTTVLIDRGGCDLGRLSGPAEWDGEAALRLLAAARGA